MGCRNFARAPELELTELDKCEADILILKAAKELIEDQEREIASLKNQLAKAWF